MQATITMRFSARIAPSCRAMNEGSGDTASARLSSGPASPTSNSPVVKGFALLKQWTHQAETFSASFSSFAQLSLFSAKSFQAEARDSATQRPSAASVRS